MYLWIGYSVTGNRHWTQHIINQFRYILLVRCAALGLTQPLTEMSTRNNSCG